VGEAVFTKPETDAALTRPRGGEARGGEGRGAGEGRRGIKAVRKCIKLNS